MKDYYKYLGVPRTASPAQIKQAYRNLVKQCHPDVNSSQQAAEWTRELNAAYDILSDANRKSLYDMDLKLESTRPQDNTSPKSEYREQTSERQQERRAPDICCEKCGRINSSIRMSVFWRVYSLINYSSKVPSVKIFCNKCRAKASVFASVITLFTGWWGIYGFFWTLEAVYYNAKGGEQPADQNAMLLNALGYQLYQNGRQRECYEALVAAQTIKSDPKTHEFIEYLKARTKPEQARPFVDRLKNWELRPAFYHIPVFASFAGLCFISYNAIIADLSPGTLPAPSTYGSAHDESSVESSPKPTLDVRPAFNASELPLPPQGGMSFSDEFVASTSPTAPLKVSTKPTDGNYVMKVEDWQTGKYVATYFIYRGGTLSVELPLGSYKFKFACGEKWYGSDLLFGPETAYSYIAQKMVFYASGDYLHGQEIQLIPQVGGNLETPSMSATNW